MLWAAEVVLNFHPVVSKKGVIMLMQRELEEYWKVEFSKLSKEIEPTCGLSHPLYQRRLSAAIDNKICGMSKDDREIIIEMAKKQFDYRTPDEISLDIETDHEQGVCSHGIDYNCCPLGCGDL